MYAHTHALQMAGHTVNRSITNLICQASQGMPKQKQERDDYAIDSNLYCFQADNFLKDRQFLRQSKGPQLREQEHAEVQCIRFRSISRQSFVLCCQNCKLSLKAVWGEW